MGIVTFIVSGKKLRIKDCRGFSSVKGLMFDTMKNKDGALIYANNIWMPFVKHELDLLFLDEKFNIVKKEKAVPMTLRASTWKVYKCEGAKYCLELKAGLVKGKITKISINTPTRQ